MTYVRLTHNRRDESRNQRYLGQFRFCAVALAELKWARDESSVKKISCRGHENALNQWPPPVVMVARSHMGKNTPSARTNTTNPIAVIRIGSMAALMFLTS